MTNEIPLTPASEEPTTQSYYQRDGEVEQGNAFLRVIMLLISLVSLGIALLSGAVLAFQVLTGNGSTKYDGIFYKILAIGLAYMVGWIVALIGIRFFHNLVLPIFIKIYAWITLSGIAILYIEIMRKLYQQEYTDISFIKYSVMMTAALTAFIGLHLLLENHKLTFFAIPLLIINLIHLYLIVYHYVFGKVELDKYSYLIGDATFFIGMSATSVLMLMRLGVLTKIRDFIDNRFKSENGDSGLPNTH